jgi:hypothetical protein
VANVQQIKRAKRNHRINQRTALVGLVVANRSTHR